jgi:hypothetical protein
MRFSFCSLLILIVPTIGQAGFVTEFYVDGAPGSFITQGQIIDYTPSNSTITATNSNGVLEITAVSLAGTYDFVFTGPNDSLATPGLYTNVTRYPFNGAGPGMALTGPGRADNTLAGQFDVLQETFNSDGSINALAVDFTQYDEGFASRENIGSLRYNSTVAVPEPSSILLCSLVLAAWFACQRFRTSRCTPQPAR